MSARNTPRRALFPGSVTVAPVTRTPTGQRRLAGGLSRLASRLPVLLLLVVGIAGVVPAPSVSAHASISSSNPADGSVVEELPEFIEIVFNEKVTVAEGSVRLVDAKGGTTDLVERSNEPAGAGARVRWDLPERTPTGWYAVAWRAVSADGHGINGTFTFFYGDPDAAAGSAKAQEVDDPTAKFINISHLLRGGTYLSVLLAVGLLAALWAVSGPLAATADPVIANTLRRAGTTAAILGLVLTPLTLLNNALLLNGGSWESISIIMQIVLQSSAGAALLVRMSALFGLCTAVLLITEKGTRIVGAVIGAAAGIGLALSFAMGGHVAVVPWRIPGSIGEVLHLVAASVWLGGIPGVAWILARRKQLTTPAVAEIVDRFSKLATASVIAVFVGGTILSVTMFTSPAEIVTTRYGVTLLVKFLLVGIVGGIGAYNHFVLVPALRKAAATDAPAEDGTPTDTSSTGGAERAHMRRSLLAEAGMLLAVVVATGALTAQAAPAAGGQHFAGGGHSHLGGGSENDLGLTLALDDLEPTILRTPLGTGEAVLDILPGRAGAENRFYFTATDASGANRTVASLEASFTLESIGIGPLERSFTEQPDGSWLLRTRDLGVGGTWNVELLVTFAGGEVDTVTFDVVIDPQPEVAP